MADAPHFRIGTRGSDLALWQAHHVQDLIRAQGGTADIIILSTQGDREQVQSFEKLEGKGFFTKEIEEALLEDRIDIAVHSHKDLETRQPEGLAVVAVPSRAASGDVLLVREDLVTSAAWLPLPEGATVGTSSVRRRDQLLLLRPDLAIKALRGNVPTRVEKLRSKDYDAIVLAQAGLDRLDLSLHGLVRHNLDPRVFVPAPAQGALALQMRSDDTRHPFMTALNERDASEGVQAERSVLGALNGGCQLPFGAQWDAERRLLRCFLQDASGPKRIVAADPEKALTALRQPSRKRILITRQKRPQSLLQRLATGSGVQLIEQALIDTRPVAHPDIPAGWSGSDPDWIWLGSPGAACAAADWTRAHGATRIAVPGTGTAEALPPFMKEQLAFVGNGDPTDAWAAFHSARNEEEHIGIPHGNRSMRRWESSPGKARIHPWVHYETVENGQPIPEHDVVCFTSPSNVEAWRGTPPDAMVAIGPTTAQAILAKGWSCTVADSPDAFGIWEAIGALSTPVRS